MVEGLAIAFMGELRLRSRRGAVAGAFAPKPPSSKPSLSGGTSLHARLWQAGNGGASVVLKRIHNGGTHSPKELKDQLDYLFSKAAWCGGNAVAHDDRRNTLTPLERKDIVDGWQQDWARNPKNGHTTHLLLSFPAEVSARTARIIAEDWLADMFETPEERGDQWAYVAALHTDRAHPHIHVVVQNRGLETGQWFYMARGHQFDLQEMKTRVADIAAGHGVALETTSRVERGILSYGAGRGEIEAAARVSRPVREVMRQGLALETALSEITTVSAAYTQLAFLARATDAAAVARRMEAAAKALAEGRPFHPDDPEFAMTDTSTATPAGGRDTDLPRHADLKTHVEDWMERAGSLMRRLAPEDQAELRPRFNEIARTAMEALGDDRGAELAGIAPQSALYRSALRSERTVLDGEARHVAPDRTERLKARILDNAEAAGLDSDVMGKRIEAGAASALEERAWVEADIASVADKKGLDLERETDRQSAAGIVDRFYETAGRMIGEVRGHRVESAADEPRKTLATMAQVEARHGQVRFESEADALHLAEDMKARYGATIMKDLAQGRTEALAKDFADAGQRTKIAEAVVSAAVTHEAFGLSPREADAAQARLRAEHATRDRAPERSRATERDLER